MFRNIRLSMKLSGGFGLVLVALIIAGVIGFIRISGVQKVVANLFKTHIPLFKVISEIDVSAAEQKFVVTQYAFHKDKGLLSRFRQLDQHIDNRFKDARELVKSDQKLVEKGWLESVEKMATQHDVFGKACDTLINAIKTDKPVK